jgi:hypothetical protein
MSIFDTKEPTKAQRLTELRNDMAKSNRIMLERLQETLESGFDTVWNNEEFTPTEILDSYGTDAVQLFQASAALQTVIAQLDPEFAPLATPNEVTVNPDGTVTVGDPIA